MTIHAGRAVVLHGGWLVVIALLATACSSEGGEAAAEDAGGSGDSGSGSDTGGGSDTSGGGDAPGDSGGSGDTGEVRDGAAADTAGGGDTGSGGDTADTSAGGDAAKGPKYVFITSLTYSGNLGGLAGADKICTTLAASAGHAGSWVAWLSDETTDALDRIKDVGPWYAMGSTRLVAATKSSFAYSPADSVAVDQNGRNSPWPDMWSGTVVGGTRAAGQTCKSWTDGAMASTGAPIQEGGAGTGGWIYLYPCCSTPTCNASLALACIEQ